MKNQEVSMDKLYKRIQERAFILTNLLCTSLAKTVLFLTKELNRLMKNCVKLNQKSRPTTLQSLDRKIIFQSVENFDVDGLT
jgi:hypothetical protein